MDTLRGKIKKNRKSSEMHRTSAADKGRATMRMDNNEPVKVSDAVERMRERKREYGLSYGEIAKRAGLPLGTVQKVLGGFTRSPRHETLAALDKALFPEQSILRTGEKNDPGDSVDGLYTRSTFENITKGILLGEEAPVYRTRGKQAAEKEPGQYTTRDREARGEIRPSELIDGVIYDMAAPTFVHQLIAGEIYLQLQNCVRKHGESCIPFMAAADVRLDRDDKTMVMPDVFVVCDPARIVGRNGRYLDGAPDLVIEVASPSTRKTDMGIKLEKYRKAGVREYWIVDYEKRKVIVWAFGDDPDVFLYGFDAEVPVGISGGKCKISFMEIVRQLRFMPGWEPEQQPLQTGRKEE